MLELVSHNSILSKRKQLSEFFVYSELPSETKEDSILSRRSIHAILLSQFHANSTVVYKARDTLNILFMDN